MKFLDAWAADTSWPSPFKENEKDNMKITVSENDIRLGLKTITSNTKCPVARALRRAGFKNVRVGVDWVHGKEGTITLPAKTRVAIVNMCGNLGMKPFSFTLTAKQVSILTGN